MTTMAFTIAACFSNAQAAGMAAFFVVMGSVVLYFIMIFASPFLFDSANKQTLWCLLPPIAVQIGVMLKFNCHCGLFAFFGQSDITLHTVFGMCVLDAVIYSFLAWYLGQVCPSRAYPVLLLRSLTLGASLFTRTGCSERDRGHTATVVLVLTIVLVPSQG